MQKDATREQVFDFVKGHFDYKKSGDLSDKGLLAPRPK